MVLYPRGGMVLYPGAGILLYLGGSGAGPGGRRSPPPQSVQPSQPGGEEQRGSLLKARQERERERLRVRLRVRRRGRGE